MNNTENFLGRRLKRLRNGVSQAEMARICGIPQSSYTRYESGAVIPKHDALCKIAMHYRITVDDLMNPDHNDQDPTLTAEEIGHAHRAAAEWAAYPPLNSPSVPCPTCVAKDKEIEWLRSTVTNLQDNFKAALAAIERKTQG